MKKKRKKKLLCQLDGQPSFLPPSHISVEEAQALVNIDVTHEEKKKEKVSTWMDSPFLSYTPSHFRLEEA